MAEEKMSFQAEVAKLLDIVVHSLYSNKEIFLRELISNASDACDKLRYESLTQDSLLEGQGNFSIRLVPEKSKRVLSIIDNGIGMNRSELVENLGTIARSGTAAFLAGLKADQKGDVSQIGQFGVGFYSAFMVADQVEVITRKAGETSGWIWKSDGKGEFSIAEAPDAKRGAEIRLHLKEGEDEFLEKFRLTRIVKTYSDHIALPVILVDEEGKEETVNSASALWTRAKSEISDEQYKEFYHHVAHAFDEPWAVLHSKAEGTVDYTNLLFIPTQKPFDMFSPERKQHVKLYVNRVFITDDCAELLPPYMRFLRGIVDSQDLPLNVSREMLQHNPVLAKIRSSLVKKVLSELKKKANAEDGNYASFWNNFGAVLKEGLYEDFERRDDILEICRFRSTKSDEPIALSTYVERMKEGQEAIYMITGDDLDRLKQSPQLEGFVAKGIEVLLLTDPIDEFWPGAIHNFKDKPLRSVAQGAADLSTVKDDAPPGEEKPKAEAAAMDALVAACKLILGDKVKDVRASDRLTESAVCLVADEGDMSIHLEKLLRQHQQPGTRPPRILELNPGHALIRRLANDAGQEGAVERLTDAVWLLLDQARIMEGETPSDPQAFARRLSLYLERGL
jgi:molecular chaperone HtpG